MASSTQTSPESEKSAFAGSVVQKLLIVDNEMFIAESRAIISNCGHTVASEPSALEYVLAKMEGGLVMHLQCDNRFVIKVNKVNYSSGKFAEMIQIGGVFVTKKIQKEPILVSNLRNALESKDAEVARLNLQVHGQELLIDRQQLRINELELQITIMRPRARPHEGNHEVGSDEGDMNIEDEDDMGAAGNSSMDEDEQEESDEESDDLNEEAGARSTAT